MMKPCKLLLPALALLTLALPASANEKGIAVIELFTTQGCSYCPPADYILEKLVAENDPDLLALSCHTTYFDRPEWKDDMALRVCDARHGGYHGSLGISGVFTPQAVINGRFDSKGNREELVRKGVKLAQSMNAVRRIKLGLKDAMLQVDLPGTRLDKPAELWLISYAAEKSVHISGGQNAGKTVKYVNVVTGIQKLVGWNGGLRSMAFPVNELPEADGYAVIAQYEGHGQIIAAGSIGTSTGRP